MIKLNQIIEEKLLKLPESGMGYQIVAATFIDKSVKESIVFNGSILEPIESRSISDVFKAVLSSNVLLLEKSSIRSNNVVDVKLISNKGIFQESMKKYTMFSEVIAKATGADKQPVTVIKENEKFIRFSHFENDKRINFENMSVIPGTYATTLKDAMYCIENELDIIERYALPNSLEIKHAFHIKPLNSTLIKRGVVEPANNKKGGGEEVIFINGTTKNTVINIDNA
jgi:hypothetical protein